MGDYATKRHTPKLAEPLAVGILEAARLCGIGKGKAYELARTPPERGGWPTVRTGGRVLVPLEGLRRWLADEAGTDGNRTT